MFPLLPVVPEHQGEPDRVEVDGIEGHPRVDRVEGLGAPLAMRPHPPLIPHLNPSICTTWRRTKPRLIQGPRVGAPLIAPKPHRSQSRDVTSHGPGTKRRRGGVAAALSRRVTDIGKLLQLATRSNCCCFTLPIPSKAPGIGVPSIIHGRDVTGDPRVGAL